MTYSTDTIFISGLTACSCSKLIGLCVSPAHPLLPHTTGGGWMLGGQTCGLKQIKISAVIRSEQQGQGSVHRCWCTPNPAFTLPLCCSLTQLSRCYTKVIKHISKPAVHRRGDWMTLQASHLWHYRIMWIYGFEKVKTDKIMKTVENLSWVGLLMPSQNIKIVGTDQKGSKSSSQHQQCLICPGKEQK